MLNTALVCRAVVIDDLISYEVNLANVITTMSIRLASEPEILVTWGSQICQIIVIPAFMDLFGHLD